MQIGDLVTITVGSYTDVGVVIQQVGVSDRWFIHWSDGTVMGHSGYTLEVLCK